MENLTFGEQVKIVLSRKKMTIKQLAELIELQTGQKMSRQNLTQRLGRDNFQEQDMRMIAAILGCPFTLNIISGAESPAEIPNDVRKVNAAKTAAAQAQGAAEERDMTIGEIYEIHEELEEQEAVQTPDVSREEVASQEHIVDEPEPVERTAEPEPVKPQSQTTHIFHPTQTAEVHVARPKRHFLKPGDPDFEPVVKHEDLAEDTVHGDINPYTGREYMTNSVRVHPKRIGYVQVYDRKEHSWTDMTEWAFLGYQERMKALLGKDYEPPIYLD